MRLLLQLLALAVCQILFVTAQQVAKRATKFTSVFAFGDSYTDNKSFSNFYASNSTHITKEMTQSAGANNLPRNSDGPLWIENLVLEKYTGADLYDFARSGATANNKFIPRNPIDMATQVNTFEKSDATNTDKSSSIFFMWIGVNDMKLLFENHRNDTSERREILVNDINSIKNDLYKIKDSGAKYIVMMGLIPLQEVPMYYNTTYDATARDNLKQLVNSYNIKLKAITRKFASKHKQTNILFFDSYNQFYKMYDADTIAKNNLMNCNKAVNCDNYIWWDNLHPSGMTHKKIATAVFDEISKSEW